MPPCTQSGYFCPISVLESLKFTISGFIWKKQEFLEHSADTLVYCDIVIYYYVFCWDLCDAY